MPPLYVLLDSLRSAYNVGSIFRTGDAAGVSTLYLTGYTAVPPEPKLQKTALGALASLPWEHHCDPLQLVKHLQAKGIAVWACEPIPRATSIFKLTVSQPTCLVFGNEVRGINPAVLQVADKVVCVPQFGMKESLNVASAAAVCIYECRRQIFLQVE